MESFLLQLFIFLAAAAIAVPVAKKLGLGSVLGYLVAGIVIGPFGISLIHDIEEVMHFTEFGVVMMLFLVGLELKPSLLWQLRLPILGMGGSQVLITSIILSGIALIFLPWQQALAMGLILSLSSTAIVLQTMQEKGLMNTGAGRSIFSVLLFQDLAVIPMLAGLPLLATIALSADGHHDTALFDITTLPDYLRIITTISAILLLLLMGRFVLGPVFRFIASTGVREVFVAAALALVIGTSVLMLAVGLSPALGAFLAGVMLADSEFRHELESDIEPFKGLLLGIFFISIGASLNFNLIADNIVLILGVALGLMVIKWLVLVGIARTFGIDPTQRSLFAVALAQGGEFAFVLFTFAKSNGILPPEVIEPVISSVAISMFLTPIVFLVHERISGSGVNDAETAEADEIEKGEHKVILAGFGHLGIDVGRFMLSAGIKPIILDHDASNIVLLRKLGFEVYYGDATRVDLLEAAGAKEAKLLVITISNAEKAKRMVEVAKQHFPHLTVVVNASTRDAAFDLMDLGATHVHRETLASALAIGQDALQQLGIDPYEAHRMSKIFCKKDQEMMPELYKMRNEEEAYISFYQQQHERLETLMAFDPQGHMEELEKAWTAKNPDL